MEITAGLLRQTMQNDAARSPTVGGARLEFRELFLASLPHWLVFREDKNNLRC